MSELSGEFDYEPDSALRAGKTGLDIVLPMLSQASNYLTDDGILVVEVGYSKSALEQALPQVPFVWLEFEYGGEGVFLLTASQLKNASGRFRCGMLIFGVVQIKIKLVHYVR